MSDKQFVDTNILVYAHDQSAGLKGEQANQLLKKLWVDGNGCLSIQVLQEFHNVVTRRLAQPLSAEKSITIIENYSVWSVHSPQVDDVIKAIVLQNRYQTSFWDALILQSAANLGCSVVWSEDLNEGQLYGNVTVKSPFSTT